MRRLAFECHNAAREASRPAATAVARACGQAAAIAHMAAHSRNIVDYTSKALNGQSLEEELDWQRAQLPVQFCSYVYGQFI